MTQRRDPARRVGTDIDIPDEAVEWQGHHFAQAFPVQDPDVLAAAGSYHRLARVADRDTGDRDTEVHLAELLGLVAVIRKLPELELAGFGCQAGHADSGTGGHSRRAGHGDRGACPVACLAFLADDQAGVRLTEQPASFRPGPAGPLGQGQALPEPAGRLQGADAGNLQEFVGYHPVQARPDQPVGRRVGRELDHLDGVAQGQLGILSRLCPVRQFAGQRPSGHRLVALFLRGPPVDARVDELHLVRIQIDLTVLQPPRRDRERASRHQVPAGPGLEPRLHVLPQALPPAAEWLFGIEPHVKLVPIPQQGLVHYLGGRVAVFVATDGQQSFVGQPDDHRPVAGSAIGPPDDPADVRLIHRGEMVDEQGPDRGPLGFAQAVQHLVRVGGQGAVQAVDPAILVGRKGQLPSWERPPHLVKGELEQRQRARVVVNGRDEIAGERIGDVKPVPLSRAAYGLAQFAFVHAAHDDGVSPQRFPETLLAFDESPEGIPPESEDDGQDAPVTKVA
jgi:hypothetical protein